MSDKILNKVAKDSIDYGYNLNIRGLKIKDEADNGDKYSKIIYYMEDKILIDNTLVTILSEESKYVGIVVRYIVDNIPYNVNHITLSSVDIAKIYNVDKGNISRAIKRLNELDVIGRLYDKIPNPYLPKNIYVINHNYLYRGSIRKLRKDILEQRQKENESKD
mgnify:FL=1|jgi:hypothetical protein